MTFPALRAETGSMREQAAGPFDTQHSRVRNSFQALARDIIPGSAHFNYCLPAFDVQIRAA